MFLAEANQWPTDVRPYFGDGDECHMAFHFPLMPRLFMALRQEDRHPITEILRQTPEIPESCQWAMFLRNHDELTLEMVTDEDRDYMYREYAADPKMRLNLGIRRRLTPLMDNSRRRLELLYSMLFSFPGTPVLYYGDEIGMGDNFYLGDRNGVRTPMQWSADRNGGFSRADFAQLYCPPIMDTVYGYPTVNVESQLRDPSSLLNWMKRIIALSKRFKTFGRGKLEFLNPPNRKVLAYVRRYREEAFLCVANLSRFVQPAELDLSAFEGMKPVEMLGRVEFPKIGKLPYFVTLGPHSFYWFQLERVPAAVAAVEIPVVKAPEPQGLPAWALDGGGERLFEGRARQMLESELLPKFLQRQRWFGGKAQTLEQVRVVDRLLFKADRPPGLLCWVEAGFADRTAQTYLLTLGIAAGPGADALLQTQPEAILATVESPEGRRVLYEALADDGFCGALLDAIAEKRQCASPAATVRAYRTSAFARLRGPEGEPLKIGRSHAEQSNSTIRYGNRLILKLFRRQQDGVNPEVEIGRYLTERVAFDRVPKTAGVLESRRSDGGTGTVAVLQELLENQGDGWQHAADELHRYYEAVAGRGTEWDKIDVSFQHPFALAEAAVPPTVREVIGSFVVSAGVLGRRTGELHRALGEDPREPAFEPEPFGPADWRRLLEQLTHDMRDSLDLLQGQLAKLPAGFKEAARRDLEIVPMEVQRLSASPAPDLPKGKIRCHGDYHLGQVLWANSDFYIIDFEGEPASPLAQRRQKQSPLRDVAGMIRSFSYAAYSGLFRFTADRPGDLERLAPWARVWEHWIAAAFLKDYRQATTGAEFIPEQPAVLERLLNAFLLEKALYELRYELDNRPAWVGIPLAGLLTMLDQPLQAAPIAVS
jgi:maltose alpha-D-glucosyltransferase/alpha-amylase